MVTMIPLVMMVFMQIQLIVHLTTNVLMGSNSQINIVPTDFSLTQRSLFVTGPIMLTAAEIMVISTVETMAVTMVVMTKNALMVFTQSTANAMDFINAPMV